MTVFDDEDGYSGPATLEAAGRRFEVAVELRGYFQPIDGRYHWYGRIAAHEAIAATLPAGRAEGSLTTPHGSAPCDVGEPDPWGRYRVSGVSTPPFPAAAKSSKALSSAPSSALSSETPPGTGPAGGFGPGGLPRHVRVAVIGAGFGGLGAGIKLREAGIRDLAILERADSIGGTWRDNTYPGCACDVPSHLYSFSFAPNPRWSRSFSGQPEIRAYLDDVADRHGMRPHLYLGTTVREARWQDGENRWRLETSRGELTADVVISAAGPLAEPSYPDIPGLDAFPGPVFHSARWDHGRDLVGLRVAVVGTGASAIQIVPEIQPSAARLVLFQRTPAWVIPRRDRRITEAEKWLYRHVPPTQKVARLGIYASREATVGAFVKRPALLKAAQRMAAGNLHRAIRDPGLRAKLTPDYVMGCKRILLSNTYYPALAAPNAEVVAAGLAKVDGSTLIAQDGTAHEADAIVFATGFHTVDMPIAQHVYGIGGRTLAQAWGGDMRALRGTTVAGFPNLCLVIGPNTGLGHNSMVHIIESQASYIVDYVKAIGASRAAALDARPEAQERWCAEVERRMDPTVWNTGGCVSWYLNAAGRNPTLWPASTLRFRRATRRIDEAEYRRISGTHSQNGAANQ